MPALEDALSRKPEPEDILLILAGCAPAYGLNVHEGKREEWDARWRVYGNALKEFSPQVIEAGFNAWDRGEIVSDPVAKGFYPRPPQLHDACVLARSQLSQMRYRIKAALSHQAAAAPPKIDPEEQKRVAADFAELARSLQRSKAPPNPAGPLRPMPGQPSQVAERLRQRADDAALRSAGVPMNAPRPPPAEPDEVIL